MLVIPPGSEPRSQELAQQLLRALESHGPGWEPRTSHLTDGKPKFTNRLIGESSPYLLQHAHNPVDWRPWGDATFEEAKALGRPVFLSVGYSTCHWCHVMEEESFENLDIARLMNTLYVPIKVDREERPDVDAIYMLAVQAMTGQGGWPMSVWLNHDREPFMGGTYFPPVDRHGRPGFGTVLQRIATMWNEDRRSVDQQAEQLGQVVRSELSMPSGSNPQTPGVEVLDQAAAHWKQTFDERWGGFGSAPKFPRSEVLRFLLRYHQRTGDDEALHIVTRTLDRMHEGGMYDHVGGGFARYSVDERWLVPHFEKMLYDNAQLVVAYLEAWQVTGDAKYADIAEDVLRYVAKEMTTPQGAFYSATDADSEGEEGKFFVWTRDQIDEVLGSEEGAVVSAMFGVTEQGNFEHGATVLHTPRTVDEVAAQLDMSAEELRARLAAARPKLYEARKQRVPPLLDDKIIVSWNGLMISAFATAGRMLDSSEWTQCAKRAARYLLDHLRDGSRLHRTARAGVARHAGTAEDYAAFAQSLLDLFEATGAAQWLDEARALHVVLEQHFRDERGGYYTTADDGEELLTRPREVYDGAMPTGTSLATLNNLRLAALTGERAYEEHARQAIDATGSVLMRQPIVAPLLLCSLEWIHGDPLEVVLVRPEGDDTLDDALRRAYLPNAVRVPVRPDHTLELPLLEGRGLKDGRATAYVCRGGTCQLPVTDADALRALLTRD